MNKTYKKLFSLVLAVFVLMSASLISFAEPSKPYVNDEMDVFTQDEEMRLNEILKSIRDEFNFDVAILTVVNLDYRTATEYADDYFDYNGFGANESRDGILFMISENPRRWAISTRGKGIEYFTPAGQDYIIDKVLPLLMEDNYYEAFLKFAELSSDFVDEAVNEKPYDLDHKPPKPVSTYIILLLFSIGAGFVIAIIIAQIMKSKLKTVKPKSGANEYLNRNNAVLKRQEDILVNQFVTFEIIERDETSRTSGADRHTSSSGSSHGGSSGSY